MPVDASGVPRPAAPDLRSRTSHRTAGRPGLRAVTALPLAVAVGATLGAAAVAADQIAVSGLGRTLVLAVSSGLSWGVAAIVLGTRPRRRLTAAISGALVLAAAVTAYYGVIAVAGTRPSAGTTDLLAAAGVWAAAAVLGGPVLGLGGWYATRGSATTRPLAWGSLGGLLAGQGVYLLPRFVRAGEHIAYLTVPLALIVIPALIVLWGSRRHRPLLALGTMTLVSVGAAVAWAVVQGSV